MTDVAATIRRINELTEEGRCAEALAVAEEALAADAENGSFWIGAGNALYGLKEMKKAEEAYRKAAGLMPADAVAPANLAGLYYEERRFEEGLDACRTALERDAEYVNAYLHRGNILTELGRYAEALDAYEEAGKRAPEDILVLYNKAQPLVMMERYDEAQACYAALLETDPDNTDYLSGLALIQEKREDFAGAADTYLHILELKPTPVGHISLAGCLYSMRMYGQDDGVLSFLDRWTTLFPDEPVARHTLETLNNAAGIRRASGEYVRELFDTFADSFDSVLESLDYKAPALIAEAVEQIVRPPETVRILDLGCGTGLCGMHLHARIPHASLTGVDLSEAMLEKARARGVYTHLHQEDILSFLPNRREAFDLIVSGDVFTYLGDLSELFAGVAGALTRGGSAVFTVSENTADRETYALEPSGRFVHGEKYVTSELDKNNLVFKTVRRVELRKEMGENVAGLLVICLKI